MGVKVREKPKDSGVFWVFVNHKGRRKSKRVGSEAAAIEVAEKIQAKLTLGEFKMDDEKPKTAFKECADRWIALPHDWKESTRESYQFNLEKHIFPVFEKKPIEEIKRKHCKAFFEKLAVAGSSRATISLIKAAIGGVFTYAAESEIIESNPVKDLSISKKKKRNDFEPLTEKEVERLLNASQSFMGGYYYPHILCLLMSGIRLGELKALQWQDIDFKKRQMEIRRSIRRGRVTDTKNRRRRRVDMTKHLAETLGKFRTEQKKKSLQIGKPFFDTDYVFENKKGEPLNRAAIWNAIRRCLKSARLRQIRIHDLRHTYATIRLLRGHNIGDVSYQLGHSSISMTYDVYGHWMPGRFKSEVDELDNLGEGKMGSDGVHIGCESESN
jgi:integrase